MRGLVRTHYQLGTEISEDITLVDGLSTQEEALATTLAYSPDQESQVSTWMKRITGVGFKTNLVPPLRVKPVAVAPGGNVNLVSEGFGANALIGLLLQIGTASAGSTVLIEEPEIHLHPKAQAELAEVLTEEAKANGKQMIMATHSEHILSRLLTLVAENKLSRDELAVYSFEKDDDGICTASEIEVTDSGQVIGGLKGFFDTNLDEMDRYVKAGPANKPVTPKKKFILDENVVIRAQTGVNDQGEPDATCANLVNSIIRICHTIVVDVGLFGRYHSQLNQARHQPTATGTPFLPVLRSAIQVANKIDGLARHNAPPFPEETSIPEGSRGDLEVTVRLAVETGATLITPDVPLIQDLESSGIQATYSLEVLTPQETLDLLDS